MRLSQLFPEQHIPAGFDPEIAGVTEDSRRVEPGFLFVAIRGTALDGHDYVAEAVGRGAVAVVAERHDFTPPAGVAVVSVPSARSALASAAARVHGNPARGLRLIGFTGTFGKTTTSDVLRALLHAAGVRVGVLGSLGARYGGFKQDAGGLTTPSPVELHRALAGMRAAGAAAVIMEVTTHALDLQRVEGLRFSDGLLAAIMPGEHTDFHRTYDSYVQAKRKFIDYLDPEGLLAYDADNRAARGIASDAVQSRRIGLSLAPGMSPDIAQIILSRVELDAYGALFTVKGERVRSSLLGRANVRNVGLALAFALSAGVGLAVARGALAHLKPVPRRMERFDVAQRLVLDDTAGHPESLLATFEVADLLPRGQFLIANAVRGGRGVDINRRNALALADLSALHGASALIVTPADDVAGDANRASSEEIDATREAFVQRGQAVVWKDSLRETISTVARQSASGDLVLLVGAQGMDSGASMLREELED